MKAVIWVGKVLATIEDDDFGLAHDLKKQGLEIRECEVIEGKKEVIILKPV